MTSERKKSILILSVTLIIGILLGLLVPGFFMKMGRHGNRGDHGQAPGNDRKKDWFVITLNHVLRPDSLQAMKIKPITQWASVEIDSLESRSNHKMSEIIDSVRHQLYPILNAEQKERLDKFDANAKQTWNRGRGHGHPGKRE